jgi:hypothetical protein
MDALKALNLGVRFFVVELGGIAAAAYWGYETAAGAEWLAAVAAPAAFIAVWGLFIAPKARVQVPKAAALAIELLLLGLVAAALASAASLWLGIAYGAVALVSGLANYASKG